MGDTRVVVDLIAFSRYLSWADLVRSAYEAGFRKRNEDEATAPVWGPEFAWMSYWYSSLFVVVEAYESINRSDAVIDALLAHPGDYKNLLRRFRNGVFYYQADLVDSRLLDLLNTGEEHVFWVHTLHDEFIRFLRDQIAVVAITEEVEAELEHTLENLTGWLPEEPEILKFNRTRERIRHLGRRGPTPGLEQQHAEILQALDHMTEIRGTYEEQHAQLRRELLRRLGVSVIDTMGG